MRHALTAPYLLCVGVALTCWRVGGIFCLAVALTSGVLSAAHGQAPSGELHPNRTSMDTEHRQPNSAVSPDCALKVRGFVSDLDKLLASNPQYIYPVLDLLKKYFPVERCDIVEIVAISRASRFFSHVSETSTYYVIAFDSKGYADPYPGFYVQFSLIKESGNSRLPFAKVNQP